MTLVQTLKSIRQLQKITQHQLAKKAGLSRASITRWENGIVEPSFSNLEKWANALGFNISLTRRVSIRD